MSNTKKRAISDTNESASKKRRVSKKNEYENYPFWWNVASPEEKERVDKVINPDSNRITLSENFPCPECKAVTPQAYCQPNKDWEIEWLGDGKVAPWEEKDPKIGRIVECMVCDNMWLHHVVFKGYPTGPHQMSRVIKTTNEKVSA